ncbi:hypothetical protein P879_09245 [Paragonimus westermani]|uniref:Exocyst complex component 5 n=1 Tax=Paragonimus westermani TaxID=34504 RepID=A0A8T0D092_9TREM|nr:hypothetical protein P879_09245 [Paragonimus westermani]
MAVSANQLGPNYGVALLDRLTKSSVGLSNTDAELKPAKLKENLGVALYELHLLKGKLQEKALKLEYLSLIARHECFPFPSLITCSVCDLGEQAKCRDDERTFRSVIEQLREHLSELTDQFNKLDTQVHMVSGKLAHLGDQLERKNLPRKRIEEARDLILEFYKFLGAGGGTFANVAVNWQGDENQLLEAASRINNLSSLCLELPDDERFLSAKQRVTVANQQLESALLERFRLHCVKRDLDVMKRISDVLVNSKCHPACVDILVGETLKVSLGVDSRHVSYKEITKRLVSAEKVIMAVFARPENALSHVITTLVTTIIKPRMDGVIKPDLTAEVYLTNLYTEYQNIDKLIKELSDRLTLITDPSQLSKLFRDLFADYLSGYMDRERECLVRHLSKHLSQFYESRGHHKRLLNTSGLADLKRDLQAKLRIQPGERTMTDYEGSLLSEEVAVNIIEDVRRAAKRCLLLSQPSEFGVNGKTLFDYLHRFLIVDHIDYGVTVALQGLQLTDTRHSPPNLVFFSIVREATSIFHFFNKTVDESLAALIKYGIILHFISRLHIGYILFSHVNASPIHSKEINVRRQSIQQELESKLQLGLDRCLGLIISRVQYVLASEQRKSDFRPDSVASGGATAPAVTLGGPPSHACQRVVPFIAQSIREAKQQLDGKNLKNFLAEFGLRFNRVLVEHYYGFTFSDTGGFLAMQDVTAYREVAKQLGNPAVDRLFDVLLKLMNLMLIKPENVQQVTQDYVQSGIPCELLNNFIQLRADYKVAKSQMEVRGKIAR